MAPIMVQFYGIVKGVFIMVNVKFTEEEVKNLKVFLGRCRLEGIEVPAFLSILDKLAKMEVITDAEQVCKSGGDKQNKK